MKLLANFNTDFLETWTEANGSRGNYGRNVKSILVFKHHDHAIATDLAFNIFETPDSRWNS